MKKFLSLLICLIMAFSTTVFAAPEESEEKLLTDFYNTYKDILFLDTNAKVEVAFLADIDNDKKPELLVSPGAYFYGLSIYKVKDGTVKLHDTITCERGTGINENYGFLLGDDGNMYLYKDNTNAQIPSEYTIYTFTEYDLGKSSSVPNASLCVTIPTDESIDEATYTVLGEEPLKISVAEAKTMVEEFRNGIAPYAVWSRDENSNYIDLETIWGKQKARQKSEIRISLQIGDPVIDINGTTKVIDKESAPLIRNNRTLVPAEIIEALGGTFEWSNNGKEVTLSCSENTVKLTEGSNIAIANNTQVTMDVAPEIIDGNTMLPVRFIAESFGFSVEWDAATQKVTIIKK